MFFFVRTFSFGGEHFHDERRDDVQDAALFSFRPDKITDMIVTICLDCLDALREDPIPQGSQSFEHTPPEESLTIAVPSKRAKLPPPEPEIGPKGKTSIVAFAPNYGEGLKLPTPKMAGRSHQNFTVPAHPVPSAVKPEDNAVSSAFSRWRTDNAPQPTCRKTE